jgi:hypothetical protein
MKTILIHTDKVLYVESCNYTEYDYPWFDEVFEKEAKERFWIDNIFWTYSIQLWLLEKELKEKLKIVVWDFEKFTIEFINWTIKTIDTKEYNIIFIPEDLTN